MHCSRIARAILGSIIALTIVGCGPLFQFGDNYYGVTFRNETSQTLLLFDAEEHQGREQVAASGRTVTRSYSGAYTGPQKVQFWNEDLTLYYCGMFTKEDFAKLQYKVVIAGPRADC